MPIIASKNISNLSWMVGREQTNRAAELGNVAKNYGIIIVLEAKPKAKPKMLLLAMIEKLCLSSFC